MRRVKGEIQVLCKEVPRFLCQIPALAARLSSHVWKEFGSRRPEFEPWLYCLLAL